MWHCAKYFGNKKEIKALYFPLLSFYLFLRNEALHKVTHIWNHRLDKYVPLHMM